MLRVEGFGSTLRGVVSVQRLGFRVYEEGGEATLQREKRGGREGGGERETERKREGE